MEQQRPRHYPREEENEEVVALRRRQPRHRNNNFGLAPPPALALPDVVVSTNNGNGTNRVHEEEAEKGKLEDENKEVENTPTWSAEEEDKGGISTAEVSFQTEYITGDGYSITSEEWNVNANRSDHIETRLDVEVSQQNVEEIGNESLSTATEAAASSEEKKIEHVENKSGSIQEVDLIEVDVESTEYDVERVIEKQNTHDLFCPNCKSCITRTVILRRKKVRIPRPKPKPKPVPIPIKQEPPAETGNIVSSNVTPTPAVEEPEVFRCLACLKFFIPKALLRGGDDDDERIQRQELGDTSAAARKKNWFIYYFFPSRYKETDEVSSEVDNSKIVQTPRDETVISPTQEGKPDEDANFAEENEDKENGTADDSPIVETVARDKIITTPKPEEESVDFKVKPPGLGRVAGGEADAEHIVPVSSKPIDQSASIEDNQSLQKQEPINISKKEKTSWIISIFSFKSNKTEDFKVKKPPEGGLKSLGPSLVAPEEKPEVGDSILPVSTTPSGVGHVVVDVGPPAVEPSAVGAAAVGSLETPLVPERREVREWDVMKSIVYGGLVESITSLGVVSSAAAAGATTLNIFAMGLANLISGFFVLGHHLRELKNEKSEETANQLNVQEDRYQKVLGKGNFSLHATVAVISYLVFGLLPPVIYGFSFRISDNRDYKLAAVLVASLICITILSIAKCYANKKPPKSYITTLLYYLSTGAVAACASYLVGVFVKKLMERLGWFDSSSSLSSIDNISFMGTKSMQPTWASY